MDLKISSVVFYIDFMKLNIVKLCVMFGFRMILSCFGVRFICVLIFDIVGVILKEVIIIFLVNN